VSQPSWRWVGFDTARELGKYFPIRLFGLRPPLPEADLYVVVKHTPPAEFIRAVRRRGARLVYAPVDCFPSAQAISERAPLLSACDLLLAHCERLVPYLATYAPTRYVDHHGRYTLSELRDFRPDGYVLWVGQLVHAPWLLRQFTAAPPPYEVRLLTCLADLHSRDLAGTLARRLGVDCMITDDRVGPYRAFNWNERLQEQMMRECKAAVDVKGGADDFAQWTKPATKAQKFVSSGIPCAVNRDSYSSEYFRTRGFEVAGPDEARWFSRDYWEETRAAAQTLRPAISLEAVGLRYRQLVEEVLAAPASSSPPPPAPRAVSASPSLRGTTAPLPVTP
jgi:hypothetical protein